MPASRRILIAHLRTSGPEIGRRTCPLFDQSHVKTNDRNRCPLLEDCLTMPRHIASGPGPSQMGEQLSTTYAFHDLSGCRERRRPKPRRGGSSYTIFRIPSEGERIGLCLKRAPSRLFLHLSHQCLTHPSMGSLMRKSSVQLDFTEKEGIHVTPEHSGNVDEVVILHVALAMSEYVRGLF